MLQQISSLLCPAAKECPIQKTWKARAKLGSGGSENKAIVNTHVPVLSCYLYPAPHLIAQVLSCYLDTSPCLIINASVTLLFSMSERPRLLDGRFM